MHISAKERAALTKAREDGQSLIRSLRVGIEVGLDPAIASACAMEMAKAILVLHEVERMLGLIPTHWDDFVV